MYYITLFIAVVIFKRKGSWKREERKKENNERKREKEGREWGEDEGRWTQYRNTDVKQNHFWMIPTMSCRLFCPRDT